MKAEGRSLDLLLEVSSNHDIKPTVINRISSLPRQSLVFKSLQQSTRSTPVLISLTLSPTYSFPQVLGLPQATSSPRAYTLAVPSAYDILHIAIGMSGSFLFLLSSLSYDSNLKQNSVYISLLQFPFLASFLSM